MHLYLHMRTSSWWRWGWQKRWCRLQQWLARSQCSISTPHRPIPRRPVWRAWPWPMPSLLTRQIPKQPAMRTGDEGKKNELKKNWVRVWWNQRKEYACRYYISFSQCMRNIDGAPITSRTHTHSSHSQTSRLLTSSLSLGVPVPRTTQCIRSV